MSQLEEKEFSEKIDIKVWHKILTFMKPYRNLVILLGVAMVFVSLGDLASPLMSRYAINNIIATGEMEKLPWFLLIYLIGAVIQSFMIFLFFYLAGRVESVIAHDMRRAAFQHVHTLTYSYHDKTPVGYLIARLTSDVDRLGETIGWSIVDVLWSFGIIGGIMIAMLLLHWRLALLVFVVIPPLAIIGVFFQRRILQQQRLVRRTNSKITHAQNESIVGARTTKTLVREELNYEEFTELTTTMRQASVRSQILSSMFWPIVSMLGSVAVGVVLWRGGMLTMQRAMDLGTLTTFISYAGQFFDPITNLTRTFAELQSSQAAAERVVQLLETPVDITDTTEVTKRYGTAFAPQKASWPAIEGNVEFKNVSFYYNPEEQVLYDFSLTVKAGETIALVGETGAGKSTLVNLLCRFYEPVEGEILIDGQEYRKRSQHWLQSNIGYVLQTPHLFSGTVRENICYGKLDATDQEVEAAAKLVNAHQFIVNLENGYDTQVGEGGNRLSTGEKQLVSFARAVIIDPRIFVLDEATSSIDTETEKLIQDAITRVLDGRTSFIIAHRLSTIRQADLILVVRGGHIVERGNHEQLMKEKGYYYELYTNQFKEEQSSTLLES